MVAIMVEVVVVVVMAVMIICIVQKEMKVEKEGSTSFGIISSTRATSLSRMSLCLLLMVSGSWKLLPTQLISILIVRVFCVIRVEMRKASHHQNGVVQQHTRSQGLTAAFFGR
jgi:preprotein translocase subunit YajC